MCIVGHEHYPNTLDPGEWQSHPLVPFIRILAVDRESGDCNFLLEKRV